MNQIEIQKTGDETIDAFNEKWTKVSHKGKNYVTGKNKTGLGSFEYVLYSHKDFIELFRAEQKVMVMSGGKEKWINPAVYWLDNPSSRHAREGFVFNPTLQPGAVIDEMFNLWVGWGTNIKVLMENETLESLGRDADIQAYLKHLRDVIFREEKAALMYFLNWLSHMVQRPAEKPGVAPILKGGKGVGKGLVMLPLGNIAGGHYLHAKRRADVTGNFNSLLENKILTFADEFGSGQDNSMRTDVSNALKGLITESTNNVERKGKDKIVVACYMRVLISSNFDAPVDISHDERRYLVIDIPSNVKRNRQYYIDLAERIKTKAFAEKLHAFLMMRDISGFNPFDVPSTKELESQKIASLNESERFLHDKLMSGMWKRKWRPSDIEYTEWPSMIMVSAECEKDGSFAGYLDRNRKFINDPSQQLGKLLKNLFNTKKRVSTQNGRQWVYVIPPLEEAREAWDKYFQSETEWN